MKRNLKILNVVLILLIMFFASAVLSNIWVQFIYIKHLSFRLLSLFYSDLLNIFFVISIIIARKGLVIYMKLDKFNFKQAFLYRQSGLILLFYSLCKSIAIVNYQLFITIHLNEYEVNKLSQYFIIALIGFLLIIISDFIRNASRIQQENELTI
jgi:hypothetical protein